MTSKAKHLKISFLKSPIKFSRISSRFSTSRFHPVQHRWKAQGNGLCSTSRHSNNRCRWVVEQSGFTAGNGNFVKVNTTELFDTNLHMSKIILETRTTCQSRTSYWFSRKYWSCHWSSCYRFWKNGVQMDCD
jgi:hypothetical protein